LILSIYPKYFKIADLKGEQRFFPLRQKGVTLLSG
jgi:hypothetical protein